MALSSAMYAAVTGLSALGTGMQTISNNIANVNTVGFKTMRTNYEDLISQNYYSGGKVNQRGTGVRVSTIQSMFTQGAFMSSAQDTDMAICGEGFFAVKNHITNSINYTRAGVFTLTKDGYMEDPAGNILQGWQLSIPKPGQEAVRIGAPTDIKLTVLNAPPAATTEIKIVTNLDADSDPVYQYKQHQLSFDYADGEARKVAEKYRSAAIFSVWNDFCEEVSIVSSSMITATGKYPTTPATGVYVPAGLSGTTYSVKVFYTSSVTLQPNDRPPSSTFIASATVVIPVTTDAGRYYPIASAISVTPPPTATLNYNQYSATNASNLTVTFSIQSAVTPAFPITIPDNTAGSATHRVKFWFEGTASVTDGGTPPSQHTATVRTSAVVEFFTTTASYQITAASDLTNASLVASYTMSGVTTAAAMPASFNDSPFTVSYDYRSANVTVSNWRADAFYGPAPAGQALETAWYNSAKVDFTPTSSITFDLNFLNTYLPYALGGLDNAAVDWLMSKINGTDDDVLKALSSLVVVSDSGLDWPPLPKDRILASGLPDPPGPPYYFKIGLSEVDQFNIIAKERTLAEAAQKGETVYATTYSNIFKAKTSVIEANLPEWKLEGLGFAAAWDARDLDGDGQYIDATGMMVEGITIYDSLGAEHQLMIYYQKNPHMDNVWDYIITADPLEDARKDSNNHLLLSDTARFSGLIQKGKITFTGDGTDRHGGVIKDIEAQNLDLSKCKMATIDQPTLDNNGYRDTTYYAMKNATIGGYYTGSPKIDQGNGLLAVDDRTYNIYWGGVDDKKLRADESRWESAFGVAMSYLYNNSANSSAKLSTFTKFNPDDSMIIGKPEGFKPTWEDYFENLWNTASAASFPANVRAEIRAYLPYASFAPDPRDAKIAYWGLRPQSDFLNPANSGRTSLYWSGNVDNDPPTSGFTWFGSDGSSGKVSVTDKNYIGPYVFGSGLTITFDPKDRPLRFGLPGRDGLSATAHSEQIAWVNLEPNKSGVYDFDVAFVNSASMALHPPYPGGMPTITQHISFDMGARNPNGLLPTWKVDKDMSTTQYAGGGKGNATLFRGQDGHAAGSLQRLSISEDGIVTGVYTNGFQLPLYQIGLTRFLNPWGLSKLGDNLFAETRYSGAGAMNEPGNAGTGTVLANFLEQSNVDVAEEIVNMILTQRGFQANSKTVTTVDTMLAEVIEMKR